MSLYLSRQVPNLFHFSQFRALSEEDRDQFVSVLDEASRGLVLRPANTQMAIEEDDWGEMVDLRLVQKRVTVR